MVTATVPMPTSLTAVSDAVSDGAALRTFAASMRRPLWGWQQLVSGIALERTPADRWRYPIVTVSVPRQSGKTMLVALRALFACLHRPGSQVWYTAQTRQDAVLRWRDMVRLLRASHLVELPSRTTPVPGAWDFRVRTAAGGEEIEFANGSTLSTFAPLEDSLHGSVTDLVILDEARFFSEAQGRALMAAVLPTQATRDGQVWIVSTAGGPTSTFLAAELDAGRASVGDVDARRAHAEWAIPEDVLDGDLLDAVWREHPSAGEPGGLHWDALSTARDAMPAWQFAHEYGNRWRSQIDARLIPVEQWDAGATFATLDPDGRPSFGVDVALDRSSAAIVACVHGVLEVVEVRDGAQWLTGRLQELAERWDPVAITIDAAGPAGTVGASLRDVLPSLLVTSTRDLTAACGAFFDAATVDPPGVFHRPSEVLDAAVATATQRRIGQAWAFSRVESGPLLLAATLAWWGEQHAPMPVEAPAIW